MEEDKNRVFKTTEEMRQWIVRMWYDKRFIEMLNSVGYIGIEIYMPGKETQVLTYVILN